MTAIFPSYFLLLFSDPCSHFMQVRQFCRNSLLLPLLTTTALCPAHRSYIRPLPFLPEVPVHASSSYQAFLLILLIQLCCFQENVRLRFPTLHHISVNRIPKSDVHTGHILPACSLTLSFWMSPNPQPESSMFFLNILINPAVLLYAEQILFISAEILMLHCNALYRNPVWFRKYAT